MSNNEITMLLHAVQEIRGDVQVLRSNVAEALSIVFNRLSNNEKKTRLRFKTIRHRLRSHEENLRRIWGHMWKLKEVKFNFWNIPSLESLEYPIFGISNLLDIQSLNYLIFGISNL